MGDSVRDIYDLSQVVTLENLLAEVASRLEDTQRESNLEIQKAKDMDSCLCQATAELQQAREELALEKEQNRRLGERDRSHGLAIEGLRKELEAQSQGASELESLVASLKEECQSLKGKQVAVEKQQSEMQEEAAHLHGKLKEARDLLEEREHEKEKLQALLKREEREGKRLRAQLEEQEQKGKRLKALLEEQRHKAKRLHELQVEKECEEKRLQELLQEKENEEKRLQKLLEERGLELQEGQGQLEETQEQAQALRVEGDSLRLKLEDRQQTVDLLQLQVEGMTQLSLQHSQSINTLQEEREWLVSEIDKHKLVVQQLKEGLEQRDNMLRALEQEQLQQKATMSEKTRNLKELMLDKKQLTGKLEVQHTQLVTLTEELESLKKTHSSKIEELEGIAAKLRAQLHTVRADLYQAKSTLRTLEGADEHGMKVAMGMQRRITAKREQIDTLQGRIQLLEETTDKLTQEKQQQAAERRRQSQELSAVSAEKKQLEAEVEALHCNEKQLRDKVSKLEAALDKMAERFTECQDFMQQQEQEYMRLKLQHALDVKELQGEKLRASGNLRQTAFCNPPLTTQLLRSQSFSGQCQQNNPTRELRSLVKELRSVIDEDDRSSPIISKSPKDRPYTSDLEPLTLHTADLDKGIMNNTFFSNGLIFPVTQVHGGGNGPLGCEVSFTVPPRYTSSPRGLALGQRSPVHSLLTSCPHPAAPLQAHLEKGPFTDFHTRKVCKRLQGKLDNLESIVGDLQSKAQEMSSMIKTEETKMGRVKDRSKLSNGLSYV
ncbi:hypothetical protein MATL_G00068110 [Megalops atlanticus]|uniref:Coiled-coil domain containing 158 n=1 Tax=Megalops atlanticus TaxID=7932 RepID=A0A9D3QCS9_MEGAT|nr:hypothetical protein MATL_G00068110 [Megalops atlanticus]